MTGCRSLRLSVTVVSGLSLLIAASTYAQPVPPPVFPAVDERGVDVATGSFVHTQTDVVIGQPGAGGLAYSRYYQSAPAFWTHNHHGFIHGIGATCSVVVATATETFTSSTGNCTGTLTSQQQLGSTLSYSSGTQTYTYTMRDGTVVTFAAFGTYQSILNMNVAGMRGYIKTITRPASEATTYEYEWESFCFPDPYNCWVLYDIGRIRTVYNNLGYRLWFSYPGTPLANVQANRVTGINQAVEYCVPTACSQPWPFATYTYDSYARVTAATNALSQATTYSYPASGFDIQFPHHDDHDINVTYASGKVSSVDLGYGMWTYGYTEASGYRTTTVTNPGGSSNRKFVSIIANGRISAATNELNQTISYQYLCSGQAALA